MVPPPLKRPKSAAVAPSTSPIEAHVVAAPTLPPSETRRRLGLTVVAVAVGAGTSPPTAQLYLANRSAVSDRSREKLDRFFAGLEATLVREAS